MGEFVTVAAPAKINLILEVTGTRPDGYHELDTVLQALELADSVTLEFDAALPGMHVDGPFAEGTPADTSNLAWRAVALLASRRHMAIDRLRITLDKQIPAAGGLGGGASDAAAALRLLGRRWNIAPAVLAAVANAIGSDPAFFVAGGGTARARGRGELLTPLPEGPRQPVVLFVPGSTIERKTARMFAALDRLPFDTGGIAEAFAVRGTGPVTAAEVYNGFERVALDLFPGLAQLWQSLEARSGQPIHLAGAGPVLFWIGEADTVAHVAAAGDGLPCTVLVTATRQRG